MATVDGVPERTGGFGPSALATPANALTAARLFLAPVVIILILNEPASWSTLAVWILVAGSDAVDGWVARRPGRTRTGGVFDPLAAKAPGLGGFGSRAARAARDQGRFSTRWPIKRWCSVHWRRWSRKARCGGSLSPSSPCAR